MFVILAQKSYWPDSEVNFWWDVAGPVTVISVIRSFQWVWVGRRASLHFSVAATCCPMKVCKLPASSFSFISLISSPSSSAILEAQVSTCFSLAVWSSPILVSYPHSASLRRSTGRESKLERKNWFVEKGLCPEVTDPTAATIPEELSWLSVGL